MTDRYSKEIRSTITSEGNVELSITKVQVPTPNDDEVVIEVVLVVLVVLVVVAGSSRGSGSQS